MSGAADGQRVATLRSIYSVDQAKRGEEDVQRHHLDLEAGTWEDKRETAAALQIEEDRAVSWQRSRRQPSAAQAALTWHDLTVVVKDVKGGKRTVLDGVSGYVQPRQMLAIMGSSGSGKTTLLDCLAGRLHKSATQEGKVLVNGRATRLAYGGAAYVAQDDVLLGTLSVRETLKFVALLRLPQSMSREEKMDTVDEIIADLGLTDAQHTAVGNWNIRGLSGGQRRRLSIGCELVLSPMVMFLDEPTSGLDAASAFYVMSLVQRLCYEGRTIATAIHQPAPEVFEMFDQLCLLTDGAVCYFGAATEAANMFALVGPPPQHARNDADQFLHFTNRDFAVGDDMDSQIDQLKGIYAASPAATQTRAMLAELIAHPGQLYDAGLHPPSCVVQTMHLTHRSFLNMLRDIGVFWLRVAMYILLCLCLGFVFFQLDHSWKAVNARAALLFFVVAFLTFMTTAAFPAFIEDMRVFKRERLNGYYGVGSFVVSNTLSSAPFILVISVLSTVSVYFLAGLDHSGDRFPYYVLNLFMSLLVVESLMMAIAPLVSHHLMGMAAGGGLLGLYMLCCGFFQPLSLLPKPVLTYPLYYIGFHSYSFHGLMANEFGSSSGWSCPCSVQPGGCPSGPCALQGSSILQTFDLNLRNKYFDVAVLVGMMVVYRSIFFATLKIKEALAR